MRIKSILAFILSIALLSALASCSYQVEENIIFYDSYLQKTVVSELSKNNVRFSLTDKNSLWYSHKDSETVKYIFDQAILNRPIRYGFYEYNQYSIFISLLEEENISVTTESTSGGENVLWVPKKHQELARAIFYKLIKNQEIIIE